MATIQSDTTQVARLFHALSDETRVRVLEMLSRGERCVCELQDTVGAAQSRLSFHLKVLREAGLVNDRKQGRWNYYSIRPEVLDEMAAYLQAQKPGDDASSGCFCGDAVPGACCG